MATQSEPSLFNGSVINNTFLRVIKYIDFNHDFNPVYSRTYNDELRHLYELIDPLYITFLNEPDHFFINYILQGNFNKNNYLNKFVSFVSVPTGDVNRLIHKILNESNTYAILDVINSTIAKTEFNESKYHNILQSYGQYIDTINLRDSHNSPFVQKIDRTKLVPLNGNNKVEKAPLNINIQSKGVFYNFSKIISGNNNTIKDFVNRQNIHPRQHIYVKFLSNTEYNSFIRDSFEDICRYRYNNGVNRIHYFIPNNFIFIENNIPYILHNRFRFEAKNFIVNNFIFNNIQNNINYIHLNRYKHNIIKTILLLFTTFLQNDTTILHNAFPFTINYILMIQNTGIVVQNLYTGILEYPFVPTIYSFNIQNITYDYDEDEINSFYNLMRYYLNSDDTIGIQGIKYRNLIKYAILIVMRIKTLGDYIVSREAASNPQITLFTKDKMLAFQTAIYGGNAIYIHDPSQNRPDSPIEYQIISIKQNIPLHYYATYPYNPYEAYFTDYFNSLPDFISRFNGSSLRNNIGIDFHPYINKLINYLLHVLYTRFSLTGENYIHRNLSNMPVKLTGPQRNIYNNKIRGLTRYEGGTKKNNVKKSIKKDNTKKSIKKDNTKKSIKKDNTKKVLKKIIKK